MKNTEEILWLSFIEAVEKHHKTMTAESKKSAWDAHALWAKAFLNG